MASMTIDKARQDLAETVDRVASQGDRIVLRRRGKPVAALVSIADLKLLEKLEDRLDAAAARKAMADSAKRIPYKQARRELGLD